MAGQTDLRICITCGAPWHPWLCAAVWWLGRRPQSCGAAEGRRIKETADVCSWTMVGLLLGLYLWVGGATPSPLLRFLLDTRG